MEDIYGICAEAIEFYGEKHQEDKAIEECSELINALVKLRDGRCSVLDVITEIADVEIMLRQLMIMFGDGAVRKEIGFKLSRLRERIDRQRRCLENTEYDFGHNVKH